MGGVMNKMYVGYMYSGKRKIYNYKFLFPGYLPAFLVKLRLTDEQYHVVFWNLSYDIYQ